MTPRSQSCCSRLSKLLLGVAPALLLAAAMPAEARGVGGDFRTCQRQDARHLQRAIAACGAVIENDRATVAQVQGALIARANMLIGRNDLTAAAADLEQAQRMGADDSATLVALGRVRARLNDPDGALDAFHEASANAAGAQDTVANFEAQMATGAIQLERRQWTQAIATYTRAFEITSNDVRKSRALVGLGHAYLGAGDTRQAIDNYEDAVRLNADSIDALLALGDVQSSLVTTNRHAFEYADAYYTDALAKIGPESTGVAPRRLLARAYAGRGDLYIQRYLRARAGDTRRDQDLETANYDFQHAVEADVQNVDGLVGRAKVYEQAPATRMRAVADLDRAIRIAPENGEIYRARGDLYALIGDQERAMRDYDEALQRGGVQSYRAYFQRGMIYIGVNDFVRADQSFAQAAALARHGPLPPDLDPDTALAEALFMRSRAQWNLIDSPGLLAQDVALNARNLADEAAAHRPHQARYEAGRCLTRLVAGGDWGVAEVACREAIRLARETNDANQLSDAYGAMGMLQLRWALAGAPNGAIEATHLQYAVDAFDDAAAQNASGAALYRYGQAVALQCLGRQIEGGRLMQQALQADRSVEARFLAHRIRHCQA
ncbi:MAG: tetratricopeptide repeat protein [Hyphomonadaceae bacterium]|nr:tetratricopeptide repeat protein [Hyphomonadaceae bacterium]